MRMYCVSACASIAKYLFNLFQSHHFIPQSTVTDLYDAEHRIQAGLDQLGLKGNYYSYSSDSDAAYMREKGYYREPDPEYAVGIYIICVWG